MFYKEVLKKVKIWNFVLLKLLIINAHSFICPCGVFSSFNVNKVQRSITLAAKFQCLKAFIIDLNQSGSRPKII